MTSDQLGELFLRGSKELARRWREADAEFWAMMRRQRLNDFNRAILAELEHDG